MNSKKGGKWKQNCNINCKFGQADVIVMQSGDCENGNHPRFRGARGVFW